MAYCIKCGKELKDGKVCDCLKKDVENILKVKDETKKFKSDDIKENKAVAILSYFGPLCLIPFFTSKESKFAQFHAKEGMTLFIFWIAYYILSGLLYQIKVNGPCGGGLFGNDFGQFCNVTPWWIVLPLRLIRILLAVIAIIGVVNVCQGKARKLPIIGKVRIFK